MSKEIESVATDLFDKIRTRFPNVTLGNDSAKAEQDPTKARFFNFKYTSKDGTEFGTVTISLIDETSLRVYYGMSLTGSMDADQRKEWYHFLRNLRLFAKRNLLTFDTRDIDKSNLELGDIKQQAKTDDVATSNDVAVTESKMYGRVGRPKLSIGEHGPTKVIVFHTERVDPEKRGAHTRKIDRIFLETEIGERFLLNSKNLRGAFAMAEHVNNGGRVDDERGQHINQLCNEIATLGRFCRATRNRTDLDEAASDAARKALHDYEQAKHTVDRMRRTKFYKDYFETFSPAENPLEETNVDDLREKFAKKIYDPRIEEALPIIAGRMNELESWVEEVVESSAWAKPDTEDKAVALQKLMDAPLTASTAADKLKPLIGDDEFTDELDRFADQPDYDVRGIVKDWLNAKMPELAKKITYGDHNGEDGATNWVAQTSPVMSHPNDTFGSTPAHSNVSNMAYEDAEDPLNFLKSLAGLRK